MKLPVASHQLRARNSIPIILASLWVYLWHRLTSFCEGYPVIQTTAQDRGRRSFSWARVAPYQPPRARVRTWVVSSSNANTKISCQRWHRGRDALPVLFATRETIRTWSMQHDKVNDQAWSSMNLHFFLHTSTKSCSFYILDYFGPFWSDSGLILVFLSWPLWPRSQERKTAMPRLWLPNAGKKAGAWWYDGAPYVAEFREESRMREVLRVWAYNDVIIRWCSYTAVSNDVWYCATTCVLDLVLWKARIRMIRSRNLHTSWRQTFDLCSVYLDLYCTAVSSSRYVSI